MTTDGTLGRTLTYQDPILDEVAQLGSRLYDERLKAELERDFPGQVVAIHPDSGEYVVARREEEAVRDLRAKEPNGLLFVRRIGPPTASDLRLAARLTGQRRGK